MILLVEGSVFTSSNILHQLLQVVTGLNIPKYYAYFGIFMTLISVILMIVLKSRRPFYLLIHEKYILKAMIIHIIKRKERK